jgi:hypothetical protein
MGMENTITEQDMDEESRQFANRLRGVSDVSSDLDVDGLTDSVFVRLKRFFSFGRV